MKETAIKVVRLKTHLASFEENLKFLEKNASAAAPQTKMEWRSTVLRLKMFITLLTSFDFFENEKKKSEINELNTNTIAFNYLDQTFVLHVVNNLTNFKVSLKFLYKKDVSDFWLILSEEVATSNEVMQKVVECLISGYDEREQTVRDLSDGEKVTLERKNSLQAFSLDPEINRPNVFDVKFYGEKIIQLGLSLEGEHMSEETYQLLLELLRSRKIK